jgi:uncharacterized membrane protein SirB2
MPADCSTVHVNHTPFSLLITFFFQKPSTRVCLAYIDRVKYKQNYRKKKEKTSRLTKACPLVIDILLLAISYLYLYIYAHSVTHFAGGGWCGVASTLGIHFFVMALRLVSSNRASAALEDFSKSA